MPTRIPVLVATSQPVTTTERIGPDVPADCPSVITGRRLGRRVSAVVALVEHLQCDPDLAPLMFEEPASTMESDGDRNGWGNDV